jgi:hypothetical protein
MPETQEPEGLRFRLKEKNRRAETVGTRVSAVLFLPIGVPLLVGGFLSTFVIGGWGLLIIGLGMLWVGVCAGVFWLVVRKPEKELEAFYENFGRSRI